MSKIVNDLQARVDLEEELYEARLEIEHLQFCLDEALEHVRELEDARTG